MWIKILIYRLMNDYHTAIATRYLQTWCVFDVISCIPSELARVMLPWKLTHGYLSILRLWRLKKVNDICLQGDNSFSEIG